jgi:hypothetical protein
MISSMAVLSAGPGEESVLVAVSGPGVAVTELVAADDI